MNTRKLILLFTALFGLAATAFADTQAAMATVAKLAGNATVTLPDGSNHALVEGEKIPQGASITTAADGEVYLQTHASTMASIKANSTVAVDELSVTTTDGKVTEEKTILNLKSGNLISALDPNKHSVNNYQVRTPKGVAAARGTTFTVTVNHQEYTVTTTSGVVTITQPNGLVVNVSGGNVSISNYKDGAATGISDLPKGLQNQVIADISVAIATIAVAADKGLTNVAELQAATTTVLAAAPQAATIISNAVHAAAPDQSTNISTAVQAAVSSTPQVTIGNGNASTTGTANSTVTTPQPIDPSTVSRSN